MKLTEFTSDAMMERLKVLKKERPEMEALSYILTPNQIIEWLHSIGVATDPVIRDIAPHVPPHSLRCIVAAPSEAVFLWSELKDAQICCEVFDVHQSNEVTHPRILDFGCGCGRITRFMQILPNVEVHGSDVNRSLVEWCQANLPAVTTKQNDFLPPLPFADAEFNFIYSVSIFTHLPEESMFAWLNELARVAADNAVIMLTTHGHNALNIICSSAQHQELFALTQSDAESLRNRLDKEGFLYVPYGKTTIEVANAGPDYGNSFTHEEFIRTKWTRDELQLIQFIPGGLRGWQDIAVLRRSPRQVNPESGVSAYEQ